MEFFKSFLRAIGLMQPAKVDFVSELPPEVSQLILRKLDAESLLCAAQVSRKWLNVCRSDKNLRRTARQHKRRTLKRIREEFLRQDSPEVMSSRTAKRLQKMKRRNGNVPYARFGAAVQTRTTEIPRAPPKNARPYHSTAIRSRKCIRM